MSQVKATGDMLTGKEVDVSMEYSRKVGGLQNGASAESTAQQQPERQMDFGSLHIKEKGDKQPKLTNVTFPSFVSEKLVWS